MITLIWSLNLSKKKKKSRHEMGEFTLGSTLYEPTIPILSLSSLPETFEPLASSYKILDLVLYLVG